MKDFISKVVLLLGVLVALSQGFVLSPLGSTTGKSAITLKMGLFDAISKAFSNEEYGPPPDAVKATARHILVKSEDEIAMLKDQLQQGVSFATLAQQYSTCPSGKQSGGSLGSFSPGTMVAEFDKVVFSPDTNVGEVMGPVQTQFGYHLIVVEKRSGGGDWY